MSSNDLAHSVSTRHFQTYIFDALQPVSISSSNRLRSTTLPQRVWDTHTPAVIAKLNRRHGNLCSSLTKVVLLQFKQRIRLLNLIFKLNIKLLCYERHTVYVISAQ